MVGHTGQKGHVAVAVLVGELRLRRDVDLYDAEELEPVPVPSGTENGTVEGPCWPSRPPLGVPPCDWVLTKDISVAG